MMRVHPIFARRSPRVVIGPAVQSPRRRVSTAAQPVRGFTLTEMLVSLAVLLVALSVVGVVFSVTTRTASEAAAYAEVQGYLRQFAFQLKEDLRYVDPARSILMLYGRTQAAGLTEDDRVAGKFYRLPYGQPVNPLPEGFEYSPVTIDPRPIAQGGDGRGVSNPRADIIMFFTQRRLPSQAPPVEIEPGDSFTEALSRGAKANLVQVVYGHASYERAVVDASVTPPVVTFTGDDLSGTIDPGSDGMTHIQRPDGLANEISPLPLTRWTLARRAALIRDCDPLIPGERNCPGPAVLSLLVDDFSRVTRCYTSNTGISRYRAGDVLNMQFSRILDQFVINPYLLGLSPYAGERGFETSGSWNALLFGVQPSALATRFVASVVDPPPPELRTSMGVRALPGCVWFHVEFLPPEEPRNSIYYVEPPGSGFPQRHDFPPWASIVEDKFYIFAPDSPDNRARAVDSSVRSRIRNDFHPVDPRLIGLEAGLSDAEILQNRRGAIRFWPYAIRITVKAIDPQGRLKEPVTRSIVHRFE